jgi:hypothetical protein
MNSDYWNIQVYEPIVAKRALLEKRLLETSTKRSALHTIARRTDRGFATLSFSGRQLWLLNQLEPKRPMHQQAVILQLTGPQDSKILERWFIAIIDRHDAMRTTLKELVRSTDDSWSGSTTARPPSQSGYHTDGANWPHCTGAISRLKLARSGLMDNE